MLEFAIHTHALLICRVWPSNTFSVLTGKPDAKTMAGRLSEVLPVFMPGCPEVEDVRAVLARVAKVQGRRNEVVHGAWGSTWLALGRFMMPKFRTKAPLNYFIKQRGFASSNNTWTVDQLKALADEIASIRLDLNRVLFPLPYPIGQAQPGLKPPDYTLPTSDQESKSDRSSSG